MLENHSMSEGVKNQKCSEFFTFSCISRRPRSRAQQRIWDYFRGENFLDFSFVSS
jgi:hypothetical protein